MYSVVAKFNIQVLNTLVNRLAVAVVIFAPLAFIASPASALHKAQDELIAAGQLPFSFDCRNHTSITVQAPATAILFTKHPVPHPNGSATVFDIERLSNHVIPQGLNSCILRNPPQNNTYCFIARTDNTIYQVGFAAVRDPGGLPPCQ